MEPKAVVVARQWLGVLLAFCVAGNVIAAERAPSFANVEGTPTGSATTLYIVVLADPPLADYAGGLDSAADGRALAKTAIDATASHGAKLRVDAPQSRAYLAHLDAEHERVLALIGGAAKKTLLPRFRYRVVTNGMAIALTPEQAAELREMPGVHSVEPDGVRYLQTDAGPAWIGAPVVWNGGGNGARGEGVVVGIIDSGINAAHPSFA
ncbi:MAG: S8 family serine peptidase, partial [Lysobacterales bacterium]